jgi:hypothetical protein
MRAAANSIPLDRDSMMFLASSKIGIARPRLAENQVFQIVLEAGQQLGAAVRNGSHIALAHSAQAGDVDGWFDVEDHPGFKDLIR